MFRFFKKKGIILASPADGKVVSLSSVNDPTFSGKMLGDGVAIVPTEGRIYAPAHGEVTLLFDTLHAVSITTREGVEVLIHVGLDTVRLKGKGFKGYVKTGDSVKRGDLLLTVDLQMLEEEGYDIITSIVICNTGDYNSIDIIKSGEISAGEDLLDIK